MYKAVQKAARVNIIYTDGLRTNPSARISSFDQKPARGGIPARARAPIR
jgi:hypothetical protein